GDTVPAAARRLDGRAAARSVRGHDGGAEPAGARGPRGGRGAAHAGGPAVTRPLLLACALLCAFPVRAQSDQPSAEERFRKLPPEKRAELRQQLKRVMGADPSERKQVLENMRRWQQMSPEQREEMRQKFREMRRQRKLERRQERQERRQERRKGGG